LCIEKIACRVKDDRWVMKAFGIFLSFTALAAAVGLENMAMGVTLSFPSTSHIVFEQINQAAGSNYIDIVESFKPF
jgi:hypothetical protein